jgi:hypothetical protein
VTVKTNYTCAVQSYGYVPLFTEYVLAPTNRSAGDFAPYIWLARHDKPPLLDSVTLTVRRDRHGCGGRG